MCQYLDGWIEIAAFSSERSAASARLAVAHMAMAVAHMTDQQPPRGSAAKASSWRGWPGSSQWWQQWMQQQGRTGSHQRWTWSEQGVGTQAGMTADPSPPPPWRQEGQEQQEWQASWSSGQAGQEQQEDQHVKSHPRWAWKRGAKKESQAAPRKVGRLGMKAS